MGTLTYNSTLTVDFDDRLLLHLQVVISTRLRRDESFLFSWSKPDSVGGRTSIWIDKHIALAFDYADSSMPTINRQWIEDLTRSAYQAGGLQIVPESGAAAPVRPTERAPR
jgi:hypothetical protein